MQLEEIKDTTDWQKPENVPVVPYTKELLYLSVAALNKKKIITKILLLDSFSFELFWVPRNRLKLTFLTFSSF